MIQKRSTLTIIHILLIILCLYALMPLMILFLNSLKTSETIRTNPVGIPESLRWINYLEAWKVAGYSKGIFNSIFVLFLSISLIWVIANPMAYSLSKLSLKGENLIIVFLLLGMTLPPHLYLVPLFFMWQKLGLVDKIWALAPIYAMRFLPFSVFLLRAYYLGITQELSDAARVDGCRELQIFYRIYLPISQPALVTTIVIVAMWVWNDFLFAITFLHGENVRTMAIRYYFFTGRFDVKLEYVAVSGVLMILPIIILYIFLQKRFVSGMTQGSLKG